MFLMIHFYTNVFINLQNHSVDKINAYKQRIMFRKIIGTNITPHHTTQWEHPI